MKTKAELEEENFRLEIDLINERLWHDATRRKKRKGANKTNQTIREFWSHWRTRYLALLDDGYKIMAARRKVAREIKEQTDKTFTPKTLNENLKE